MHCPAGNATDPIWRVLGSSLGISSWTPLKPQHSNPNPNPLANQLWCIDFLTPPTPLTIPHRLPALLESLMPLKNWCSIHARWSKSSLKHSIRFCGIIFSSLKQNFIAHRSSKESDWIFEIPQLWQSGFSWVYSNCCCSCSFEPEIIKIGQSSHKLCSNNIVNFQESMKILNACTKKVRKLIEYFTYVHTPAVQWEKKDRKLSDIYVLRVQKNFSPSPRNTYFRMWGTLKASTRKTGHRMLSVPSYQRDWIVSIYAPRWPFAENATLGWDKKEGHLRWCNG